MPLRFLKCPLCRPLRAALAALAVLSLCGCRATPPLEPQISLTSVPEPALPVPAAVDSTAFAHLSAGIALELEASRLERLFNYQRFSTGATQPSLLRDARRLRESSLAELDAALADDPASGFILRTKGDVLFSLTRVDEAVALYAKADLSGPARPRWYFQVAGRLELLGRFDDAVALLERALSAPAALSGQVARFALLELARIYDSLGRFEMAESALNRAIELDALPSTPDQGPLSRAFASRTEDDPTGIRRLLVGVLIKQAKFDQALDQARRLLAEAPRDARALTTLVAAFRSAGRGAEALDSVEAFVSETPDSRPAVLTLMRLLAARGRIDEAVRAGKNYLSVHPDDAKIQTEILSVFRDAGRTSDAETFALSGESGAASYPASLALLDIHVSQDDSAKALALAQKVLRDNPFDEKVAIQVVARLYDGLGSGEAAAFVKSCSESYPDDLRASYAYARILRSKGMIDQAGEIFASLADKNAHYADVYEFTCSYFLRTKTPYDAALVLLKGVENGFVARPYQHVMVIVEEAADPAALAEKLISHLPDFDSAATTLAELLAGLYSRAEDHAKAEEFYRKALEDPVPQLTDYAGLALSLYRQDKIDQSISLVEDLMRKGQGAPPMVRMLVAMLSDDRRFDDAERIARKLISEQPTDIDNRLALVSVFIESKDYDKAETELNVAMDLSEGDNASLLRVGYLLAIVYDEQGKDSLAVSMWRANIALDPSHPDSNNALGYHFAERGENLDEAEKLVLRALESDPENGAYLDSLGWVYYKMERFPAAVEYLKKAADRTGDTIIFDHLADALLRSGDSVGALAAWKKALDARPSPEDRSRIELKIQALLPETSL